MPKAKKQEEDQKDPLKQLDEKLSGLPKEIQQAVGEGINSLFKQLDTKRLKEEEISEEDEDDEDEDENKTPADLSKLSEKDKVDYIINTILSSVDKKLKTFGKDINKEVTTTKKVVSQEKIRTELKEARDKYKDFDEFKEDIGNLAKTHPSLSVEDLYLLARVKNPEKVKELDTAREKIETEKKEKEDKSIFGGLTPTSGRVTSDKGNMSRSEAIESAWDETMGSVPSHFIGNSND